MNKEAVGLLDSAGNWLKEKIGPQDPTVQSYLKNILMGSGIGALGLGGATSLFDDDPDAEKRNRALKNNLLMGAALGGLGGAGWTAASNLMRDASNNGSEKNWLQKAYFGTRGLTSYSPPVNAGVAGGLAYRSQAKANTKINNLLDKINLDQKFNFDPTFPSSDPLQPLIPDPENVTKARAFVQTLKENGGGKLTPPAIKAIIDRFYVAPRAFDNTPVDNILKTQLRSQYPNHFSPHWEISDDTARALRADIVRDLVLGENNPIIDKGNFVSRLIDKLKGAPPRRNTITTLKSAIPQGVAALEGPDSVLNRVLKYIPFSPAGKFSRSPLQKGLRAAIPTFLASHIIDKTFPFTFDKWLASPEAEQFLRNRGLSSRAQALKEQLAR